MRKGMIASTVGVIIVSTFMFCNSSQNKLYEKKVNYKSTDEVIQVVNDNPIAAYEKGTNNFVYSNEFIECLSKRKRITESLVNFVDLDLEIDEERNTEEGKNAILSEYFNRLKNLEGYEKPTKVEAVALKGTGKIQYSYDEHSLS